jgi:hypothetical protein
MDLSRALSALLAASVLTACATSAAAPSRTPTPVQTPPPPLSTAAPPLTDAQIARRGVVRSSDFPAEWKSTPPQGKRLVCPATSAARKAASAVVRSHTFTNGPNTEVEVAAYVFRKQAGAQKHYTAMTKREFPSCLMRGFTNLLSKAGYKIGTTIIAGLPLDPVGDERSGMQLTIPVSRQGVDANILFDLVVARTGRALALELFVDAFDPFDSGFRGKLTTTQLRRLHDAQLN